MTDERERPTVGQPLRGPHRNYVKPLLIVIAILAVVAAIFLLTGYLRYES